MTKTDDLYLLGIDIGISTAKAALFTLDGEMLGLQSEEYLLTPDSQIVESDPGPTYWEPIVRAVRRLLQAVPGRAERPQGMIPAAAGPRAAVATSSTRQARP